MCICDGFLRGTRAAADDEPWYELASALLGTFAGFVVGVALGWHAIDWGVDTLRDVGNRSSAVTWNAGMEVWIRSSMPFRCAPRGDETRIR